jgi:hypothetical protein
MSIARRLADAAEAVEQVVHPHRGRVTAARLLAMRRDRPDAMLPHVAEAHRSDFVAVRIIGPAGIAGRVGHP